MRNSTGSVRQRGTNSWELRIYQGVDPENGKERWATKTVRGSRRFATAQLREFRQVAICGRIRAGTVAELLTQWTEAASPGWAATTKRETKSLIDRHLIPCLGHLAIAKLTTADIDDFYGHLLRRGGKDERPLAPGTVQRTHVVLHRALARAVRWNWIWVNPASQSSPPRAVPPEIRPPSPEAVTNLLSYVARRDRAFHLFLVLAATTGARRGELLALRWMDVDLVTNTVSFQRSLVEGAAGPVLAPTKTRRSHRVALDQATADALDGFHDDEMSRGRGSRIISSSPLVNSVSDRGYRTTQQSCSFATAMKPSSLSSGSMISGTSWPHRCLTPAYRSRWSPGGSLTPAPRRRSTSTPTWCRAAIVWLPRCCVRASRAGVQVRSSEADESRSRIPPVVRQPILAGQSHNPGPSIRSGPTRGLKIFQHRVQAAGEPRANAAADIAPRRGTLK